MTDLHVDRRPAFERAVADPALLDRFTASYGGRFAPLDALWWLDRPDRPTPAGVPSPAVGLAELRRTLYARDGDPSVAAGYAAASAEWAAERTATMRALEAAMRSAPGDTPSIATHADSTDATDGRSTPHARIRRRTLVAVAATVAGVAALVIAGAALAPTQFPGHLSPTFSGPSDSATWSIRFTDGSGGSALPTTPPAPAVHGTVLATVTNDTAGPSKRSLDGRNRHVTFALRCAGVGEVYAALSDGTSVAFVCDGIATETVTKRSPRPLHTFGYVITTGGSAVWSMRIYRAA